VSEETCAEGSGSSVWPRMDFMHAGSEPGSVVVACNICITHKQVVDNCIVLHRSQPPAERWDTARCEQMCHAEATLTQQANLRRCRSCCSLATTSAHCMPGPKAANEKTLVVESKRIRRFIWSPIRARACIGAMLTPSSSMCAREAGPTGPPPHAAATRPCETPLRVKGLWGRSIGHCIICIVDYPCQNSRRTD
jgi:hypothetical protein